MDVDPVLNGCVVRWATVAWYVAMGWCECVVWSVILMALWEGLWFHSVQEKNV